MSALREWAEAEGQVLEDFDYSIPRLLPGTGTQVCECGRHRMACRFGRQHGWSLATVDHRTGKPLAEPLLHCMDCDAYCLLD